MNHVYIMIVETSEVMEF